MVEVHLFEYIHGTSKYVIDVPADSSEEAIARLRSAGQNAKYLGVRMGVIPAGIPGAGWYVRFRCWLHNVLARR